jgi:hypothetical protein
MTPAQRQHEERRDSTEPALTLLLFYSYPAQISLRSCSDSLDPADQHEPPKIPEITKTLLQSEKEKERAPDFTGA